MSNDFEALHPRTRGRFAAKDRARGTSELTVPKPRRSHAMDCAVLNVRPGDFERGHPVFDGWPESLPEPELEYLVRPDGSVETSLEVPGHGELAMCTDHATGRAVIDMINSKFTGMDEQIYKAAAGWALEQHLNVQDAIGKDVHYASGEYLRMG